MKINLTEKQKNLFSKVSDISKSIRPIYLVGGAVRDIIMGVEPKDYDFCTELEPHQIEHLVKESGRRAYLTGKRFGTIGCKIDGQMIEITTFRTEKYTQGNRKPEVEYVNSITEDLSRRDFTINAMAIRLDNYKLIDPFNGEADLKLGCINAVGNPKIRFKEDPLRMLRAIRLSAQHGFYIEEQTFKKIQSGAIQILNISKERWVQELDKLLQGEHVGLGLFKLWQSNLLKFMIPELQLQYGYNQNSQYHSFSLDEHTIRVVESVRKDTDDLNMLWAALLHDIAKPFVRTDKFSDIVPGVISLPYQPTIKSNYVGHEVLGAEMVKKIAEYLKWSNDRTEKVYKLVLHHLENDCPLRYYDNVSKTVETFSDERKHLLLNEKARIEWFEKYGIKQVFSKSITKMEDIE